MTSSYSVRKPCNHVLHLILSLITFGMWLPVWAVVAAVGRKETVTYPGALPPRVPMPPPNAVNPYNGHAYYDANRPPITYPPGHPVDYGP